VAEQAVGTVQVDNDRVNVAEWSFAPGAETGHHRHEFDYVVVSLTHGKMLLRTKAVSAMRSWRWAALMPARQGSSTM
jgi:hypothetical protein